MNQNILISKGNNQNPNEIERYVNFYTPSLLQLQQTKLCLHTYSLPPGHPTVVRSHKGYYPIKRVINKHIYHPTVVCVT